MCLFRQFCTSPNHINLNFTIFPKNNLVSLFRILLYISHNIYTHLIITIFGGSSTVLLIVYEHRAEYSWVTIIINLCMPLLSITTAYTFIRQRKAYENHLKRAVTIAESLSDAPYYNIVPFLLVILAILLLTVLALAVLGVVPTWMKIHQFTWVIFNMHNTCLIASFSLSIAMPQYVFQRMRNVLPTVPYSKVISFLGLYDELVDICKAIEGYYGVRNNLNMAFTFSCIFYGLFSLVREDLKWLTESNRLLSSMVLTSWNVTAVSSIALLIFSCSSVCREAKKFNFALTSFVIRDESGSHVSNPYISTHFASGKKVKFSAFGCFYIDYRLGYSMLAASITYLMILLEIDNYRSVC